MPGNCLNSDWESRLSKQGWQTMWRLAERAAAAFLGARRSQGREDSQQPRTLPLGEDRGRRFCPEMGPWEGAAMARNSTRRRQWTWSLVLSVLLFTQPTQTLEARELWGR